MKIMPHERPGKQARDWDEMSYWEIERATGINAQTIHMRCKRHDISKSMAVALGQPRTDRRRLV